jgi:Fur family ferric uptake transcriptional regulator
MDPQVLVSALHEAGYRLTAPRRAVAEIVAAWAGHFTAAEVAHEADERGLHVGRATVFRTLDALERASVVERIDLPSGEHAYVACEPAHHHHVVCSGCGRTDEVEDGRLAALVASIGRRTGYRIDAHRLELYGLCATCQAAPGGSR